MAKKIADNVQNVQKNEPRQDPKELFVAQKSKQVEKYLMSQEKPSSIGTSSSNKQKWSNEDVEQILIFFWYIEESPTERQR